MPGISKLFRDAIRARLAAVYEDTLGPICLAYGIARPQAIVFDDPKSRNFFMGQLHPDSIEGSTVKSYPMAVLYTQSSANSNEEKYRNFSGQVVCILDIYLSWRGNHALHDHETLGDAVEETLYRVFNAAEWADAYTDLAYNGELSIVRRPLEEAGEHWRQAITARLVCQIDS